MRKRTQLVGFDYGNFKHTQYAVEFADNALDAIENNKISLYGMIASLDGSRYLFQQVTGSQEQPGQLGQDAAQCLLDSGGNEILQQLRNSQIE